jgi:hypothetical protein
MVDPHRVTCHVSVVALSYRASLEKLAAKKNNAAFDVPAEVGQLLQWLQLEQSGQVEARQRERMEDKGGYWPRMACAVASSAAGD